MPVPQNIQQQVYDTKYSLDSFPCTGQEKDDQGSHCNWQDQFPLPETKQDLGQYGRQQQDPRQACQDLKPAVQHGTECRKRYHTEGQTKQHGVGDGKFVKDRQIRKPAHQSQIPDADQGKEAFPPDRTGRSRFRRSSSCTHVYSLACPQAADVFLSLPEVIPAEMFCTRQQGKGNSSALFHACFAILL